MDPIRASVVKVPPVVELPIAKGPFILNPVGTVTEPT
jgi:hypothetical protein